MSVNSPEPAKEPALLVGLVTSVITTGVGLLVAFGIGVTPERASAIVAFVLALAAAAPLVAGWVTRGKVFSPATMAAVKRQQQDP